MFFPFVMNLPADFISHMASKSSSVPHASDHKFQKSTEDRMAILVNRVGEVTGLVHTSSLYWNSIKFFAKDEVSRGIFYALPDRCKLHYLKRKIKASNMEERELSYEPLYDYWWNYVFQCQGFILFCLTLMLWDIFHVQCLFLCAWILYLLNNEPVFSFTLHKMLLSCNMKCYCNVTWNVIVISLYMCFQ